MLNRKQNPLPMPDSTVYGVAITLLLLFAAYYIAAGAGRTYRQARAEGRTIGYVQAISEQFTQNKGQSPKEAR